MTFASEEEAEWKIMYKGRRGDDKMQDKEVCKKINFKMGPERNTNNKYIA